MGRSNGRTIKGNTKCPFRPVSWAYKLIKETRLIIWYTRFYFCIHKTRQWHSNLNSSKRKSISRWSNHKAKLSKKSCGSLQNAICIWRKKKSQCFKRFKHSFQEKRIDKTITDSIFESPKEFWKLVW